MSARGLFLAGLGAASAYVLVRAATAQNGGEQPQIILASAPQPDAPKPTGLQRVLPILNTVLDLADMTPLFGGGKDTPQAAQGGATGAFDLSGLLGGIGEIGGLGDILGGGDSVPATTSGGGNIGALKSIIIRHESGGNYNAVWGRISAADRPRTPITQMTVGQVLDWQDSIDRKYMSEAAGAWQFLEDTLRDLVRQGHASKSERFTPAVQDRLAVALMDRRGLSRYKSGLISDVAFAQSLSKEWASLPAQTVDKRGRRATGQSYYAGDGLNKALTSKEAVLAAVRSI